MFEDLKTVLVHGRLHHNITVGQTRIVLRSLSEQQKHVLHLRAHGEKMARLSTWVVASSIYMVDGVKVSSIGGDPVPWLQQRILHQPKYVTDRLFYAVMELQARMRECKYAVYPFCHDPQSRVMWSQLKVHPKLRLDDVTDVWVSYNQTEDDRLVQDRNWDYVKFLASATVGSKAMVKVEAHDKSAQQKLREYRDTVLREYYAYLAGVDPTTVSSVSKGPHKTVLSLEEEFQRWVNGEEDEHDRIIREYKQRVMENREALRRQQEERLAQINKWKEEEGLDTGILKVVSPEELREMSQHRGVRQIEDTPKYSLDKALAFSQPAKPENLLSGEEAMRALAQFKGGS